MVQREDKSYIVAIRHEDGTKFIIASQDFWMSLPIARREKRAKQAADEGFSFYVINPDLNAVHGLSDDEFELLIHEFAVYKNTKLKEALRAKGRDNQHLDVTGAGLRKMRNW